MNDDLMDKWREQIARLIVERDEARSEMERLKSDLHDARLENSGQAALLNKARAELQELKSRLESSLTKELVALIRPEPSRLEIAAQLMCVYVAENKLNSFECVDEALVQADALIAAAKKWK